MNLPEFTRTGPSVLLRRRDRAEKTEIRPLSGMERRLLQVSAMEDRVSRVPDNIFDRPRSGPLAMALMLAGAIALGAGVVLFLRADDAQAASTVQVAPPVVSPDIPALTPAPVAPPAAPTRVEGAPDPKATPPVSAKPVARPVARTATAPRAVPTSGALVRNAPF